MKGRSYTYPELRRIQVMRTQEGLPYEDIGKRVDRSPKAIAAVCTRNKWHLPAAVRRKNASLSAIRRVERQRRELRNKAIRMSYKYCEPIMNGPRWSKEELSVVKHLRSDLGLLFAEIAARLNKLFNNNRSYHGVKWKCAIHHFYLPADVRSANIERGREAKRAERAREALMERLAS